MKAFRDLDGFQLVGFVLSALISLGLLLAKLDAFGSIILGLVLAVGVQLLDMQMRQSTAEERVLRASGVSPALCRDDELFKGVQQIVDDCVAIEDGQFEFFTKQARSAVERCRTALDRLADGWLEAPLNSQSSYSRHVFKEAKRGSRIKATVAGNVGWQNTADGQTYVQLNTDAAGRQVDISRTFICSKAELSQVKGVLQQELRAHIKLFWVDPDSLHPDLRKDYLIENDQLVIEVKFGPDGQGQSERIYIDHGRSGAVVQQFVADYDQLALHHKKIGEELIAEL